MNEEPKTLYQVLYLKDGENALTEPESNEAATKRAKRMDEDGYQVGAIMDTKSASEYVESAARAHKKIENGRDPFDPFDPILAQTTGEDTRATTQAPETLAYERHHRRCTSVDMALRMANNTGVFRTAADLVTDAQTILDFLEG